MPRLQSVQDLDSLRQNIQQQAKVRLNTGTTITVGTGTCGVAAGARDTLSAIEAELAKRKIQAEVATAGCIGICVKEPLVDIQQAGKPRIVYANITADMVPRLIEEHLVQGRPVRQWVIGRMTSQ